MSESNTLAWRLEWEASDHDVHGTEMAGLALFGDQLGNMLLNNESIELAHRLESVKILPPTGSNEAPHYGPITIGSMLLVEDAARERQRVFSMAVTAQGNNPGTPSVWSASLDQITSGAIDESRRLIIVSGGNIPETLIANYGGSESSESSRYR